MTTSGTISPLTAVNNLTTERNTKLPASKYIESWFWAALVAPRFRFSAGFSLSLYCNQKDTRYERKT